jgi:hypothetical protein
MSPNVSAGEIVETDSATEQTPLLNGPKPSDDVSSSAAEPAGANLRIVLPPLMICAFLAAFDVTVVAAIYPIMYPPQSVRY